jgi:phenylalanyl-tRNA synthetase alpha chain
MREKLIEIKEEILKSVRDIKDSEALFELEKKYIGRKGELTGILKKVASLSPEDKKTVGAFANTVKKEIFEVFQKSKSILEDASGKGEFIDMSLPGEKPTIGSLNPISSALFELEDIFSSMGFMILDGPELESDFYNFEALNIPEYHPARDMQDTFYVRPPGREKGENEANLVMRTHTSPMQIRAMRKYGAPLKCVVPGRVFRNEAIDANHETNFYQLEGLMVGEDISLANLISVLKAMLEGIFKKEVKVRVRPGYFPFVEPGIEVDMNCLICGGSGCPACKHSGWLEMIGAGMVHPRVLEYGNIDPNKYSGFAFGMGVDRLVMMRHNITDVRLFYSGDLRFLEQFKV